MVNGDSQKTYFLIGAPESRSAEKLGLVILLPGGGGGAAFHPFCKRIYKHALGQKYIAAQPVSVKWTARQRIVWPTKNDRVPGAKFTTEQFVEEIIGELRDKFKIDPKRIFTLSWSSSGPAAYEISFQQNSPVTGSYIAMSVFRPKAPGWQQTAKKHAYFIDHSPEDKTCPYRMAKKANQLLSAAGAKVKLNTYSGGHGWHGDVYGRIRYGIAWLEKNQRESSDAQEASPVDKQQPESHEASDDNILLADSFDNPALWTKGQAVKSVRYLIDKKNGSDGKNSLCLRKTEKRYWPIAQWSRSCEYKGNAKQLEISAKVRALKAAKAIIDIQFQATGTGLSHQWAAYIGPENENDRPVTHNWKSYSKTITIPDNVAAITVALQMYGPGSVWFDELILKEK